MSFLLPPLPLSHLHTLPDHLCIQLSISNCQSQSDLRYIWEVTKYDGEGDNISRPLRRTGTLQCALNNRPVQWQKSRMVIASQGTQCSLGGGNWDHVSTPPTPPFARIREETELSRSQYHFQLDEPGAKVHRRWGGWEAPPGQRGQRGDRSEDRSLLHCPDHAGVVSAWCHYVSFIRGTFINSSVCL